MEHDQIFKVTVTMLIKVGDGHALCARAIERFALREYEEDSLSQSQCVIDHAAVEFDVLDQLYSVIDEESLFPLDVLDLGFCTGSTLIEPTDQVSLH